jgi:hypothetical protein
LNAQPLDIGGLPTRLRLQAGHCLRLGSPLYAGLLRRAADDAEAGGPTATVLRGHEGDPVDSMLALRLMGAVHRRVLEGHLPELEPFYLPSGASYDRIASKSRTAVADAAWLVFRKALTEDEEALRQLLDRPVQTNEVGRCAALLPGFLAIAAETGLPLRLLEVGSSAGLNLRWDRYYYEADGFRWGDPGSFVRLRFELGGGSPTLVRAAVAERSGCDRRPIDPTTDEGRLTLLSYVWPDQRNRIERVKAALEVARKAPVEVDRADAVEWIERRLAAPREGVATVIFHSIVMQYLPQGEREEFRRLVEGAGAAADVGAPLAWLRMEPAGGRAEVRLTLWPDGGERLLARVTYHGDSVDLGIAS